MMNNFVVGRFKEKAGSGSSQFKLADASKIVVPQGTSILSVDGPLES